MLVVPLLHYVISVQTDEAETSHLTDGEFVGKGVLKGSAGPEKQMRRGMLGIKVEDRHI